MWWGQHQHRGCLFRCKPGVAVLIAALVPTVPQVAAATAWTGATPRALHSGPATEVRAALVCPCLVRQHLCLPTHACVLCLVLSTLAQGEAAWAVRGRHVL